MRNHGLNIEKEIAEQSPQDWVRGVTPHITCLTDIAEVDREDYLPPGEVQSALEDMQDCASRGPLNILEAKFTWLYRNNKLAPESAKWLEDNGYVNEGTITFSDAFIAINSGTTRSGNSLKAPLESIRKQGLIPKKILSLEPWMTFDDYYDRKRITTKMMDLGAEFAVRFTINYEQDANSNFENTLKEDYIIVGGYAWPEPDVNGEYPATDNSFNHCFILVRTPKYLIFDNYIDAIDGDYIKKLSTDYKFMEYGYRIVISKETIPAIKKSLWQIIIEFFRKIWKKDV